MESNIHIFRGTIGAYTGETIGNYKTETLGSPARQVSAGEATGM